MANDAHSTKDCTPQNAKEYALITKLDGKVGTLLAYHVACLAILDGGNKSDWREQLEALQAVLSASKKALMQIDEAMPSLLDIYQKRLLGAASQVECQP